MCIELPLLHLFRYSVLRNSIFTSFLCALLVCQLLLSAATAEAAVVVSGYSIVLASAPGKSLDWKLPAGALFEGRTVYVERSTLRGLPWERLCVGFFESKKQAISLQRKVLRKYPGAWVQKASDKNIVSIISDPGATTIIVTDSGKSLDAEKLLSTGGSTLSEKQLDSLMQRAKNDLKKKRYSSSTRYLNALIDAGEHKYSRDALELLGLVSQRKGQKTRAISTYEKYLELYPNGKGSDSVRQRLTGLLTETKAVRKKLHMVSKEDRSKATIHGGLSQFYQVNRALTDDIGSISTVSQLTTLFDLTALQETGGLDHRYHITADHIYDFAAIINNNESEFRFVEAYYELTHRNTATTGRLGRQRLPISGILKRFDGLTVGYQFTPKIRLSALGGFPVDINGKTSINEHKSFYGLIVETGTFLDHWSMNLFYFDEKNDGLTNSNNVGTEVRYRGKRESVYGMVDYDLFYNEINILQLNASIVFDHGRTAYLNVFLRKSPLLSTSNALIGRSERTIDELKKVLNVEQIYQLAKDRTADRETVTLGGTQKLSKKFQVTADITLTDADAAVITGNVVTTPGANTVPDIGTSYFFSTQLVGNNLLMKSDTGVVGLRYYDTDLSKTISFIVNARFPIARNWRINPRFQIDTRKLNGGDSQRRLRTILRTDYRYRSNVRFDFEAGYDEVDGGNATQLLGSNNLFFTLGYRWNF